MKHLKTYKIFELHKDTYRSAKNIHKNFLGNDDVVDRYDKLINDDEHSELPEKTKDHYRNLRKDFRKNPDGKNNWRETIETIETWLPYFPGFYNSIYDLDTEQEDQLEHINEIREEKGWDKISWDDVEWEYHYDEWSKNITYGVEEQIKDLGFYIKIVFQKLVQPKYYNYGNDSINIELTYNPTQVITYLMKHEGEFREYLNDNYTSRSGFNSSYSNSTHDWIDGFIKNEHMVGSIFNFILENEDCNEYDILESTNGEFYVSAKNFNELTEYED